MKIHLTGSSSDPGDDLPYLRCIIETLHNNKVSIVLNWIEAANNVSMGKANSSWSWKEIIENNLDAVDQADALIVEGTSHGFFQGFQVSKALNRRLPVLFVSREAIELHPIAGISNKLLKTGQYDNESDLKELITNFIKVNKTSGNHVSVSENAMHFIRGESLNSGLSDVEIIDSLLSGKYS